MLYKYENMNMNINGCFLLLIMRVYLMLYRFIYYFVNSVVLEIWKQSFEIDTEIIIQLFYHRGAKKPKVMFSCHVHHMAE